MLALNTKTRIREKLIKDAIKDLQRWMFPKVDEKNIFYDITYSYFFVRILQSKKGMNKDIDLVIDEMIFEIKYIPKKV